MNEGSKEMNQELSQEQQFRLETWFREEALELNILNNPLKAQIANATPNHNIRRFVVLQDDYHTMFEVFPSIEFVSKLLVPHFTSIENINYKEISASKELVFDSTNLKAALLKAPIVTISGNVYNKAQITNTNVSKSQPLSDRSVEL